MTEEFLKFLRKLIKDDNVHSFYVSGEWTSLRADILEKDKNECQRCKEHGIYKKANTVHHVNHVKLHPELALDEYYTDENGEQKRNLVSLCHDCHEIMHGRRVKRRKKPLTEERW